MEKTKERLKTHRGMFVIILVLLFFWLISDRKFDHNLSVKDWREQYKDERNVR